MKDTHERHVNALVERSMALASESLSIERTPSRRIEWSELWIVLPDWRATTSAALIGLALPSKGISSLLPTVDRKALSLLVPSSFTAIQVKRELIIRDLSLCEREIKRLQNVDI